MTSKLEKVLYLAEAPFNSAITLRNVYLREALNGLRVKCHVLPPRWAEDGPNINDFLKYCERACTSSRIIPVFCLDENGTNSWLSAQIGMFAQSNMTCAIAYRTGIRNREKFDDLFFGPRTKYVYHPGDFDSLPSASMFYEALAMKIRDAAGRLARRAA